MAYASLVSLTNTLDENIQLNLIPQNNPYIQTLLQEASFFQDFLGKSSKKSSETAKYLESRVRDAAYNAQDIIDSHVDNRFDESVICLASLFEEHYWDECLLQDLNEVIEEINSIKQEVMLIMEKEKDKEEEDNSDVQPEVDWDECLFKDFDEVMEEINSINLEAMQIGEEEEDNDEEPDILPSIFAPDVSWGPPSNIQPSISAPVGIWRPSSHRMTTSTMVGLDDQLKEIKTQLVSGSSQREIVALVGMGGIGKTTLAQKVYNEKSTLSHFDICGWATVSQEHNMKNILLGLLHSMGKLTDVLRRQTKEKLAEVLYKNLKHRRYFIVLDDMWDTQVWDYLKRILANDENGSRVLLTTRLKKVAEYDNDCPPHHMRFLNDEESWSLFCENVFGHNCCPLELEKVGKEIVRNCRGLPLEVNVIGGHLSKATRTPQYWRNVAKNLSETIASEGDDQCSRVLSLSYKHLPNYLKGCFLYMSIFSKDYDIEVSKLLHLWIASGLVKRESSKSFEDVAKEYFLDLVERNLILVWRHNYNGKILCYRIHDLIRDLCVKEAKSEKFFYITNKTQYTRDRYVDDHVDVSPHSRSLRAILCFKLWDADLLAIMENRITNIRFLYGTGLIPKASEIHKFVHLHTIHVSSHLMWEVNILKISNMLNIWEMPQLRHVNIRPYVSVPDPLAPKNDEGYSVIVLGKLQTIKHVANLTFTDEVLQRIQNIKNLSLGYHATNCRDFDLNNLKRLSKLESLRCCFYNETRLVSIHDMSFSHSIKKLTLLGSKLPWKDMTVVGSLPNLQVLKLKEGAFRGQEWEPNEGEFLNLKTLYLSYLGVVHWRAEAVHFPMLQHLFISYCNNLLEIPSGVGEIPTLQLINVKACKGSVTSSAKQIKEEQHNFGNEVVLVITEFL